MNERGDCYCEGSWKDPRRMKRRGIPPGYCGICEVCGQPGHMRHTPIPAPYTGAWCDDCYDSLANDYDDWRALNPSGYTADFAKQRYMDQERARREEAPHGWRKLRPLFAWVLRR